MSELDIPNDPAGLTAEWLTRALRAGHSLPGATVKAVRLTPGQARKSIIGQVVRVTLQYDQDVVGQPPTLIAKFPTPDQQNHAYFHALGMYEREIRFYQEIADRVDLPVPKCYFASVDIATGNSILLLEDMAPHRNGNRVEGCSLDTTRMLIHQVARLHSAWWENEELQHLTWLQSYDLGVLGERYRSVWASFVERYEPQLAPETIRLAERLASRLGIIAELFRPPLTLVHHDYQLDNMFFTGDPERPLVVVDWQLITLCRGVLDVANFLCWNVQPDMRQRDEMELLRMYHATLVEGGIYNYSFDQCLLDYRLALLECFIRIVAVLGSGPPDDEHLSGLFDTILARTVAALQEQSAIALLT